MSKFKPVTEITPETKAKIARTVGMTMVQDGYRKDLEKKPSLKTNLARGGSIYAIGAGVRITLAKEKAKDNGST